MHPSRGTKQVRDSENLRDASEFRVALAYGFDVISEIWGHVLQ